MANQKRNRALLIINYDFYRSQKKLTDRPGAKNEADRLFKALSDCNYAVQLRYDLTAKEIQELYEKECDADHGDYFVSILSSHGEEGVILDCEGQPVQLTQIFHALSSPRSHKLAGKPKIFFIQACRGKEIDPGVWLQTDSGYAAFINRWESMFLKALLEFLEGEERQLELARLMTRINWKIAFHCEAKGKYSGGKEMPCFVTNMVKEVFPFSSQRRLSSSQ